MDYSDVTYSTALEKAGAEVLAYGEFGSYQGDWLAKVRYQGREFWIHDYYGSCSGCDALQADMGYENPTNEALVTFGRRYLEEEPLSYEQALGIASQNYHWDSDAEQMIDFVKANA